MTKKQKLFDLFLQNPKALSYAEIKKILLWLRFEFISGKTGSYVKFRYQRNILIFSPHNGKIKEYQKEKARNLVKKLSLKIL